VNSRNDGTPTALYLVRIWRRKSGDGSPSLHGKLQHVVSGEACYFDGLSGLPGALEKMMHGADTSDEPEETESGEAS
jgi:hypothetical protein